MNSRKFHATSALAGVAGAALVAGLLGFQQVGNPAPVRVPSGPSLFLGSPVVVEGIPTPDQMVAFQQTFTVPPGKRLVITGLGSVGNVDGTANLFFDGAVVLASKPGGTSSGDGCSVRPVPPGLTAKEGVVVTVSNVGVAFGRVHGYLVDA
jgi:hypothetical protein